MSEPAPASARADLVGRVLGYMDRPWKALVVFLLLIIGGLGYMVWEERDRLADAFLPTHHGMILADEQALTDAALHLVGIDQAAMAQVWTFDIAGNAARFIVGINHDGTAWKPTDLRLPNRLPVIVDGSDQKFLVTILRGDPVCADAKLKTPSILFERLSQAGIKRTCVVPIPPISGHVLAVFIIGWLDVPDERMQNAGIDSAVELAGTLVSR